MLLIAQLITIAILSVKNVYSAEISIDNRIVGGNEVSAHTIKYIAGLFITRSDGLFFCGGVLISKRYVLTSASCLDSAISVEVRLGAHRINENEGSQTRMNSTEFNIHSDWNSTTLANDIATIALPEAVTLNYFIETVRLPSKSEQTETFTDRWGVLSGWGRDSDEATGISSVLRAADAVVISNTNCISYYGTYITPGHICTSGVGGVGSCGGDGGGPLTVDDKLVGIISFASSTGCEEGLPTTFTRITSYFNWIENHSNVVIGN